MIFTEFFFIFLLFVSVRVPIHIAYMYVTFHCIAPLLIVKYYARRNTVRQNWKNSALLYYYYLGPTPIVHVVFREKGGNFPDFSQGN